MTQPADIIYDLTLEAANGICPICMYIKFQYGSHDRYIVAVKDPITQNIPRSFGLNPRRLEEAVQLFKWAIENDPDPVAPAIAEFIKSI